MNAEQELKVQAWVDGELPDRDIRDVARLVESDLQAGSLVNELRMTKGMFSGNETTPTLPEGREFFWSKIQRDIQRIETAEPKRLHVLDWILSWRRFAGPISGMALIAFMSVVSLNIARQGKAAASNRPVEVENLCEEVGSIAYKSQSDNMFVVYLYNREPSVAVDPDLKPAEDGAIPIQ